MPPCRPLILAALAAGLAAAAPAALHAEELRTGELRAGAGRADITSPAAIFPYKVPHERDFVGVHDNIYARALVLDNGASRLAIVTLDLTAVPDAPDFTAAIAAAAGVSPDRLLLVATHTHIVPLTFYHGAVTNPAQPDEIARARAGAVAAATAAVAALQPARIGFARTQAPVNVNNGEEAGLPGAFNPAGSSDHTLSLLRLTDLAGKPLAVLVNFASHGEVMFRSVTRDGGYEESGDLPGAVSRLLEAPGAGVPVALYTPAAEGDQLPLFKSLQAAGALPATDEGAAGWALVDVQARRIAALALAALGAMPEGSARADIRAVRTEAVCPGQHFNVERPSGKILGIDPAPPVAIPVTVLRINDIALAGVGADLASDIGQSIKRASPLAYTMVVSMTAGAVGYVLNDAAYAKPGHGAIGSPVKPGCAPQLLPQVIARAIR